MNQQQIKDAIKECGVEGKDTLVGNRSGKGAKLYFHLLAPGQTIYLGTFADLQRMPKQELLATVRAKLVEKGIAVTEGVQQ